MNALKQKSKKGLEQKFKKEGWKRKDAHGKIFMITTKKYNLKNEKKWLSRTRLVRRSTMVDNACVKVVD